MSAKDGQIISEADKESKNSDGSNKSPNFKNSNSKVISSVSGSS